MQWSDKAIVVSTRKYGESSSIITLFTLERGIHAGMVRGATGKKKRGIYQVGNLVEANWTGRIAEHLGSYNCELVESVAGRLLSDAKRLAALSAIVSMIEKTLPEREPHSELFSQLLNLLHKLTDYSTASEAWVTAYIHFEMAILSALGFGLDFSECAATGSVDDLIYVSPKSGRAVSREAGEPYKDKLLPLPSFLRVDYRQTPTMHDIMSGFDIMGYFLRRWMFQPHSKTLPPARERLGALMIEEVEA